MLKNMKKVGVTLVTAAQSNIVRRFAVNFVTGFAIGALCDYAVEEEDSAALNLVRVLTISAAVLIIGAAVNDSFDAVLEKHDQEVYDEYDRKMKEIG